MSRLEVFVWAAASGNLRVLRPLIPLKMTVLWFKVICNSWTCNQISLLAEKTQLRFCLGINVIIFFSNNRLKVARLIIQSFTFFICSSSIHLFSQWVSQPLNRHLSLVYHGSWAVHVTLLRYLGGSSYLIGWNLYSCSAHRILHTPTPYLPTMCCPAPSSYTPPWPVTVRSTCTPLTPDMVSPLGVFAYALLPPSQWQSPSPLLLDISHLRFTLQNWQGLWNLQLCCVSFI